MSIRTALAVTTVVLACIVGAHKASAEGYVSLRAGLPLNDLEYERVLSNGVGLSIAGTYSTWLGDKGSTTIGLGGGLRKYFGDHRVFYLGANPQLIYARVTQREYYSMGILYGSEYVGTGTQVLFLARAAAGWRGVWRQFAYGGEFGAWIPSDKTVNTEGASRGGYIWEDDSVTPASKELSLTDERSVVPAVCVFVGYKF